MFDQIVTDIKDLKIQGAINIAKKALEALYEKSGEVKSKSELEPALEVLKATRPTEPALRNALRLFLHDVEENLSNREDVYKKVVQSVDDALLNVQQYGANLIENGMIVFTHCHSSSVTGAMIEAKKQGKNFEVYNSETRPLFQGRKTALELAQHGIKVSHMVDNAAYHVLRKCDLFFFGADAINSYGNVFNKVGTKMLAETAKRYDLKTFSITSSIKYDFETIYGVREEIEKREVREVWDMQDPNITIFNPAFDEVEKEFIDGIVSEFGVLSPDGFLEKVQSQLS